MTTPKSNKNLLTLAIVVAALLASGCTRMLGSKDAVDVRSVADKIAGYTLPAGYSEQFAVDALGYQLVSLQGPTESCHIYLIQAPADTHIDADALQQQAHSMDAGRQDTLKQTRIVEERPVVIRGQEVSLVVGEGVNSEEQAYRQVTALFEGREGQAVVNISAPESEWDWSLVEEFLASIQ